MTKHKLADWIEELAPGERRTTEPRTFALEQKQRAAAALVGRAGSAREIADEAGSSRCTLYKWKRELLGEGPDMTEAKHDAPAQGAGDGDGKAVWATQADIDALEARKRELVEELRRLEIRRDVMEGALGLLGKGAGADPANEPANREKTLLVESLRPKWGLSELLRALGMARSSHQYQLKAMGSPDGDAEARGMACAVFDANDGTYGRRRTRDELKARGHVVGERRIRRIMVHSVK